MVSWFLCLSCFSCVISWLCASASACSFLPCSAHLSASSSASFSLARSRSAASLSCSTSLLLSAGDTQQYRDEQVIWARTDLKQLKSVWSKKKKKKKSNNPKTILLVFPLQFLFLAAWVKIWFYLLWPASVGSADWCSPPSEAGSHWTAVQLSPDPGCRC